MKININVLKKGDEVLQVDWSSPEILRFAVRRKNGEVELFNVSLDVDGAPRLDSLHSVKIGYGEVEVETTEAASGADRTLSTSYKQTNHVAVCIGGNTVVEIWLECSGQELDYDCNLRCRVSDSDAVEIHDSDEYDWVITCLDWRLLVCGFANELLVHVQDLQQIDREDLVSHYTAIACNFCDYSLQEHKPIHLNPELPGTPRRFDADVMREEAIRAGIEWQKKHHVDPYPFD